MNFIEAAAYPQIRLPLACGGGRIASKDVSGGGISPREHAIAGTLTPALPQADGLTSSEQRRDCATFNGPRNTAPSTKRSGKARAFLPSSMASLPSALMPAATPTLAFCLTTLPRPGMARSSAPNRLLTSWVLHAGRDAIERRLRHALLQHLLDAERRDHLLDAGDRHLQFAIETPLGVRPSEPAATAIRSPCWIRDCTISTWPPAAWISRNRCRPGFWRRNPSSR